MTGWFYFWSAVCLLAAFGIGFWAGLRMMYLALEQALKKSVESHGFFEVHGVRFIAVVTNPNPKG